MSVAENEALVRGWMDRVVNGHDPAAVSEFFASDFVSHQPGDETVRGRAAWQELVTSYLTAFPDYRLTIETVVAQDDHVAVRWTATGTHRGAYRGVAATGLHVKIAGIEIDRIADGRVAESWSEFNREGLVEQLRRAPASG